MTNTETAKATAGAIRAAKAMMVDDALNETLQRFTVGKATEAEMVEQAARIIDRETAAPELVAVLHEFIGTGDRDSAAWDQARALIARVQEQG